MVMSLKAENPDNMLQVLLMLRNAAQKMDDRILTALNYLGGELQSRLKANAASQLDQKSGKLQRAIYFRVNIQKSGSAYILTAGVARRAFYAAFQEKGIKPRFVQQRSRLGKKYDRLLRLRARPFIGPSILEMQDEIMKVVEETYAGVWTDGA